MTAGTARLGHFTVNRMGYGAMQLAGPEVFGPLQSAELDVVAAEAGATPMQVALAWLLQRAPNILLIPGTSSLGHLQENLAAASLTLSAEAIGRLDAIGAPAARI